eukprot:3091473-Amphidinium_carterae.1
MLESAEWQPPTAYQKTQDEEDHPDDDELEVHVGMCEEGDPRANAGHTETSEGAGIVHTWSQGRRVGSTQPSRTEVVREKVDDRVSTRA